MKLSSLTRRVEKLERVVAKSKRSTGDIVEQALHYIGTLAGARALPERELTEIIREGQKSPDQSCTLSPEQAQRILEQGDAISRNFSGKSWAELYSLPRAEFDLLLRNRGITNVTQITQII